jgi:hypothetical protein
MRLTIALLSLVFLVASARAAQAQSSSLLEPPRPRQGYYMGAGLLAGAAQNWDDGDGLGVGFGNVLSLRLGQLITRRFGLGFQLDSGGSKSKHVQSTIFDLGLEAHWELFPNVVTYGGIGLGVASIKDDRDIDAGLRGAFGTAYSLGVSYDWFPGKGRLSGGFSLSPKLMARFIPGDDIKAFVGLLGLELAYWTGLPKNQLELTGADAYRQ